MPQGSQSDLETQACSGALSKDTMTLPSPLPLKL